MGRQSDAPRRVKEGKVSELLISADSHVLEPSDLWTKGRVRRGWRLAQRVVSLPDDNPEVPAGIRALQLWHPRSRLKAEH